MTRALLGSLASRPGLTQQPEGFYVGKPQAKLPTGQEHSPLICRRVVWRLSHPTATSRHTPSNSNAHQKAKIQFHPPVNRHQPLLPVSHHQPLDQSHLPQRRQQKQENYKPAASGTVWKHSSEPTWGRAVLWPLDDERDPLQRATSPTQ